MKETLQVLNRMVAEGVIADYAIGGAIGAIYYLEPFETSGLDVFVEFATEEGNALVILQPIYDYLRHAGFESEGEFIKIEGLPVQFLPSFSSLTDEAIERAQTIEFDEVKSRIMRPEYLVALMISTGRPKDYLRISMFLEQQAVDMELLRSVLQRHNLVEKWEANAYRFKP